MAHDIRKLDEAGRQRAYKEVSRRSGDVQFFTRREINELPRVMADGELLIAFSSGQMRGNTWLIALTDRRVLFLDKGLIAGLKQTSIPLDKVNAVSGVTGWVLGKLSIEDGADSHTIENVAKSSVQPFVNMARDAIEARRRTSLPSASQPVAQTGSPEDRIAQLERLAVLRDKGVLTPVEFEAEKARILRSAG